MCIKLIEIIFPIIFCQNEGQYQHHDNACVHLHQGSALNSTF